jgi:RNA polymerase sigma-70 factor (ECF subfamily)
LQEGPADTAVVGDDGPLDLLLREEQEAGLMRLIDELPAPQRSVLLLHFVEDFSLEEIARITQAPIGTVKSRLHYAKRALRKLLEERPS